LYTVLRPRSLRVDLVTVIPNPETPIPVTMEPLPVEVVDKLRSFVNAIVPVFPG
jgi:hypothetical protein